MMQIESEHMENAEHHCKLSNPEYQRICQVLKEFGEIIQVKASKESIMFSVQAGAGGVLVALKPRCQEAERPTKKARICILQ